MARNSEPLGPAENTAERTRRLAAEAKENQVEERQITKIGELFEAPDGSDNRVYDLSGEVVDDYLPEPQKDLFASMVEEVEDNDVIDLGDGSFSNVQGVPPKVAVEKVKNSRAVTKEPAGRKVVTRPPEDPQKVYVDVQALDDIEASVGFNDGKTYKLDRGKVYRVPMHVARWLVNQKYVGPPPQHNWFDKR